MFHFPAFPPTPYEFGMQVTRHDSRQVTPFGHPGITARLTAPPGLSQPPTSFIGPWYQGIHRPPLPTYPTHKNITYHRRTTEHQKTKMLASTMQISTHHQPTTTPPTTASSTAMPGTKTTTPQPITRPTVVLSEPQQGVHRRLRHPAGRLFPHPAPRPTPCHRGHDDARGRTRPDPARHRTRLASVSAHEHPGGPVRAEPGSLPTPHPGESGDAP
jgi:hypothetical protein